MKKRKRRLTAKQAEKLTLADIGDMPADTKLGDVLGPSVFNRPLDPRCGQNRSEYLSKDATSRKKST